MSNYETWAQWELSRWEAEMQKDPSLFNRLSKGTQERINKIIPERIHNVVTTAIKQMTRAVIAGAGITTTLPLQDKELVTRELLVKKKIKRYRRTAMAEGAVTGAGGILLGFADFPLWLTIKVKLLFEIAAQYGYDTEQYTERLYILHIFHLTFSSQKQRQIIFDRMVRWEEYVKELPSSIHGFDWRSFQLEYRDYIDLAKLLQLIPGFGAIVGAYVNHTLTDKLARNAMQSYRLRYFKIQNSKLGIPEK